MFEKPGTTLKAFASIYFWICLIGNIILGFALGKITDSLCDSAFLGWLLAFVNIVTSFVISLLMSTFADIAENADLVEANIELIANAMPNPQPQSQPEPQMQQEPTVIKPVHNEVKSKSLKEQLGDYE